MIMAMGLRMVMGTRTTTTLMRAHVKVFNCNFAIQSIITKIAFISDEEPEMTEIWFTPTDENTIEDIFNAMKYCQSLHPDENGIINTEK